MRPGGRLVVAGGFLSDGRFSSAVQQRIYRRLCECWVIEELGQLHLFTARLEKLASLTLLARLQLRVAPSVAHIPWVTLKFLLTDVVFGHRQIDACALEQCSGAGAPATSQRATRTNDLLHDRSDETLAVATADHRL